MIYMGWHWITDVMLVQVSVYLILIMSPIVKTLINKSRERRNHKPQPNHDTKRNRKRTKTSTCKTNTQMHEKHIDRLPRPQASGHNAKWNEETRGQRARQYFKTFKTFTNTINCNFDGW